MFSDVECFVQSQISGVVFACNYLGFNVLGVVMISYEVFFHRRIVVGQMFFHAIVSESCCAFNVELSVSLARKLVNCISV